MDLDEKQIQNILTNYKNKRIRENKYYHEVSKHKEEFKIKNRQRAKLHYENGYKEKKKINYENNKEFLKNKSLYNYYKRNDKIEVFKEKHKDKYDMLVDKNYVKDE
jgi:hypothetical protein|tara:strand:- start:305 stop:622 length:318 start_codon:yes stop_codon:yes gene_type:complete